MRGVAVVVLVAACSTPSSELPARAVVTRGVFVEGGGYFAAASSASGSVARENRDAGINLLGSDLKTMQTIGLTYELQDQREIVAMAYAADGAIAAATWELDDFGQPTERSQQHLVYIDPSGNVAWSKLVLENVPWTTVARVAISGDQVFVTGFEGNLRAYSRATGEVAWQQPIGGVDTTRAIAIAALPAGDVAVATDGVSVSNLVVYASDGTVRWSQGAETFGMHMFSRVAYAADGTLAVVGDDGGTTTAPQRIALVEADGGLRWSHSFGDAAKDFVTSLATDGIRIVAAGDASGVLTFDPELYDIGDRAGYVAAIGTGGVEGVQPFSSVNGQLADVLAMTSPDSAIIRVINGLDPAAENRESELHNFTIPGAGMALFEIELPH